MSRQQHWAKVAFETTRDIKRNEKLVEKFRTHALKFPALLMQSGLAQAVAFTESRDDAGKKLIAALGEAVDSDLSEASRTAKLDTYTRLSAQVLAASAWFRRFASELEDPNAKEDT